MSINTRSRYGSTDASPHHEGDALLGEGLVMTDNEDDTPNNSETNLMQMTSISNGDVHYRIKNNGRTIKSRTTGFFQRIGDYLIELHDKNTMAGYVTKIIIIGFIALCIFALLFMIRPGTSPIIGIRSRISGGGESTDSKQFVSPFPSIDRSSYGKSASEIVNPELFHPDLLHNATTNETQHFLRVPFPTGAFWTNLVLKPTSDRGFSYPVVTYPYAYNWNQKLLQASYPSAHRVVDKISIHDNFIPDLTFGIFEDTVERHIVKFDPLSVTTRFRLKNTGFWESYLVQGSPYITIKYEKATPTIRALSIFKDVLCPFDGDGNYNDGQGDYGSRSLRWGVCSSTDKSTSGTKSLNGVQFLLQTQEGLTWILFASEPISLSFNVIQKTTVSSSEPFRGVLRLAIIPPSGIDKTKQNDLSSSAPFSSSLGLRRLIYHAGIYPVGGSLSWSFRSESSGTPPIAKIASGSSGGHLFSKPPPTRVATLNLNYETMSMADNSNSGGTSKVREELLMLSLPHHAQSLSSNALLQQDQFDLVYQCIKGSMMPVVGDSWSLEQPLTSIEFDDADPADKSKNVHPDVRKTILKNVQEDLTRVLPTFDENVYGFGKQVARLAQLSHIANEMESTASSAGNETDSLSQRAVQTLHKFLSRFLTNEVSDELLYDVNFGGIVTKDGITNSEADFGNGWYNDHHFHYGYLLFSCAIMGKLNSTFVSEYGSFVDAILYDVAYSGNGNSQTVDNAFFPLSRHKSWFDGHSFASGLFSFGNGKSQESSSEAVNCYYGAYLWSLVRFNLDNSAANQARVDFAKLLLATEIRGARTYWHMMPPQNSNKTDQALGNSPAIYSPTFSQHYMVGNLGMLDAICSTWFGTSPLYVHMINFMPVTAATSLLFDERYVRGEYNAVVGPMLPNTETAWSGYVIADHAIIDPSTAWLEAKDLISHELDAGLSKSQLLYWISTRHGFQYTGGPTPNQPSNPFSSSPPPPPPPPSPSQSTDNKSTGQSKSSQSCETNEGCKSAGLLGQCCPTNEGIMLGCCDKSE